MREIGHFTFTSHTGEQGLHGKVWLDSEGNYIPEAQGLGMGHKYSKPRRAAHDLLRRHGGRLTLWQDNEFEPIKKPTSASAAIKNYRAQCGEIKRNAERMCRSHEFRRHHEGRRNAHKWHFAGRGVEIVALDQNGERDDYIGGPEYIASKDLTVGYLKQLYARWSQRAGERGSTLSGLHLAGGFDVYDSFGEYMQSMKHGGCYDYEIWDDWAGQDVPAELLA